MRIEASYRRGHDVRHDARTLAAAEHEKPQRVGRVGADIRRSRGGNYCSAHRIAGAPCFPGELRLAFQHAGKTGGDRRDPRGKQPIGPPDHGILLVNERRNVAQCSCRDGRNGGISAEPHDGCRLDPAENAQGLDEPQSESRRRAAQRNGIAAAQSFACDNVHLPRGKFAAVTLGAVVGREIDGNASPRKHLGQGFGGE